MSSFSESLNAVPDGGGSSEYELAEQDAQHGHGGRQHVDSRRVEDYQRPDLRPPRGNPAVEDVDLRRGREQLERVISK